MDAATAQVPQVQKRQYRNNTAGWIGVVMLDHNGAEQGVNIEPKGTIWLSDAEAILTARAPKRPEDNPFLERTYVVVDPQTGQRRNVKMRPVELVSDRTKDIFASDRYVPGIVSDEEARVETVQASREGTDGPRTPQLAAREAEIVAGPVMQHEHEVAHQQQPVPPSTGAPAPPELPPERAPDPFAAPVLRGTQGAAGSAPEEAESWTAPPEAPGEVLAGALQGDDSLVVDAGDPTLPQPGDESRTISPPVAPPETVGAALGAEEHAAAVDPEIGEETGAARPPTERQPEGEFAQAEEVGSPDAPTADLEE